MPAYSTPVGTHVFGEPGAESVAESEFGGREIEVHRRAGLIVSRGGLEDEEGVFVAGSAGEFANPCVERGEFAAMAVGEEEKLDVRDLVGAEEAGLQRRVTLCEVDVDGPELVLGVEPVAVEFCNA